MLTIKEFSRSLKATALRHDIYCNFRKSGDNIGISTLVVHRVFGTESILKFLAEAKKVQQAFNKDILKILTQIPNGTVPLSPLVEVYSNKSGDLVSSCYLSVKTNQKGVDEDSVRRSIEKWGRKYGLKLKQGEPDQT